MKLPVRNFLIKVIDEVKNFCFMPFSYTPKGMFNF